MIDSQTIARVIAAADIVAVVGDYVSLKRAGVNYKACCPFHDEKTPSFVVSPAKGFYKCFGCGKGGNAINFVMEHEKVSYPEAIKIVGRKFGIEVVDKVLTEEETRQQSEREDLFALNSWALEYFKKSLFEDEGQAVGYSYFSQNRGFRKDTIERFALGYCPSSGSAMSQEALRQGFKEEVLVQSGLGIKGERDGRLHDRFRERVIFPIHNIVGRIVGFGGRTLRSDKTLAKYLNSPESIIYSKRHEIYGLYFAKTAIQKSNFVILVEGYADVISMHQAGIQNVVASSGTALTSEQIRLLRRFTLNMTLMFDGDKAGVKAALKGVDLVLKEGLNVSIVLLPEEHDPDTFARSHSSQQVNQYISEHSENFLTFKTKLLMGESTDPSKKSEAIQNVVTSIAQIDNPITKEVYIKECSKLMDISEDVLRLQLARQKALDLGGTQVREIVDRNLKPAFENSQQPSNDTSLKLDVGSSTEVIEKELIHYLLCNAQSPLPIKEGIKWVDYPVGNVIIEAIEKDQLKFQNPIYQQIFEMYSDGGKKGEYPTHSDFINHIDPKVSAEAISILTSDDEYVESAIWRKSFSHRRSLEERLQEGVPKALNLFIIKAINSMKDYHMNMLSSVQEGSPEYKEHLLEITKLDKARVLYTKKIKRLI
ncbi:MAG: DNA primase [Alistipes sp.]|nr:DNA primase [Candidatus Alistipes equi]